MKRRALAVLAFGAALGACGPQAPAGPDVKLYAMQCGLISTSDAGGYADDGALNGQARDMVDPCFLIRHPNGDLIWDAGLPDALADNPAGLTSGAMRITMPVKLVAQLAELGLTPDDIEFVSFSHSHFDHVGNANLFAHAIWIADAEEREWMFRDEARASEDFQAYSALENTRARLITDENNYDVFEDSSVVIVPAPGHTPGHTVLLLRLPHAGAVLLSGDMWHTPENRTARRVPTFNTDREQTLASMDKVEALAAETRARVVLQHVPADFAALPKFPEALN